MRQGRWFYPMALVVLSCMLVGTLWVVPYLPTNDGPEWVFATHAENHYSDPGAPYAAVLVPTLQFAARGFSPFYGPFEAWLGWERGLQIALSLIVLLVAWGFVALVHAIDRERWAIGLLGFPLALSWELYMGLWSFVVATGIGFFVLALAVRLREPTWKGRAVIALLLLVQAVAHVFGAVLTGSVVLLLGLTRARRGQRLRELVHVALTGAPAFGILVACVWVSRSLTRAALAADFERFPWREALAILPRTIAPGPLARALVVTLATLVAATVAGVRAVRTTTDDTDRALGLAAILLLLAGTFTPFQIPGWQAFSERFIPLGVALAFAALPFERVPPRSSVRAGAFAAALVWLSITYPLHRRLAALCPDAIAGLDTTVRTTGTILPVVLRKTEQPTYDRIHAEVPIMNPLVHMGTLYAAVLGGLPAYSFTGSSAIYPFIERPELHPRPLPSLEHYMKTLNSYAFSHDLPFRLGAEGELASFGMFYDEVVVFGAIPADVTMWRDRGYAIDAETGTTFLGHFEPCAIDFTVPAASADPAPTLDVHVGTFGLVEGARVEGVVKEDGLAHFALTPAPCGEVAVRARWATTAFCTNADAAGEIVGRVTRRSHAIACEGVTARAATGGATR
jgi:hypothetical protein